MFRTARLYFPFFVLLAGCASTATRIPEAWLSVPAAPRFRTVVLAADGKVTTSSLPPQSRTSRAIRVEGGKLMNGAKALTEAFPSIESFDVSESRGEVVFAAKRDSYDIGLVSTDGSQVNWIPSEPLDELSVQWAPRGNKVSYIVRAPGGDLVRTVHIPTSVQRAVDFPYGTVHTLAWDAAAERFAVAWASPDASDRVEVMKYGGEQRRMAVAPPVRLDVEVEPFAPGALVLRPRDLTYNERVPLVIWRAEDYDWNDARAALIRNAKVAVVITKREPGEELWRAARETAWIDASRAFAVGALDPNAVSIIGAGDMPAGRYRKSGNVVSVAPAVVQSFAAGFIADQLERTIPTNGSSR